jgi:hypothetical protein
MANKRYRKPKWKIIEWAFQGYKATLAQATYWKQANTNPQRYKQNRPPTLTLTQKRGKYQNLEKKYAPALDIYGQTCFVRSDF